MICRYILHITYYYTYNTLHYIALGTITIPGLRTVMLFKIVSTSASMEFVRSIKVVLNSTRKKVERVTVRKTVMGDYSPSALFTTNPATPESAAT